MLIRQLPFASTNVVDVGTLSLLDITEIVEGITIALNFLGADGGLPESQ